MTPKDQKQNNDKNKQIRNNTKKFMMINRAPKKKTRCLSY